MSGTKTTMDQLATGALFAFSESATEPRFEKISNLYAKDLWDNEVRPNAANAKDAASVVVYCFGSAKSAFTT